MDDGGGRNPEGFGGGGGGGGETPLPAKGKVVGEERLALMIEIFPEAVPL